MNKINSANDAKISQLEQFVVTHDNAKLTTDQGVGISDTDNSLKAGSRGPTLMQDFIFREKVTHFDHERIPERVVHARGSGAHGYFECYRDMTNLTMAKFLSKANKRTPVFARFSTVAGFRGSPDTVRDVRGFAVKFYTEDGNYDLVGNNMPIFFIQDAIKFPDIIHALKPEQNNEMPQAASAHDTFWDFVTNNPETAHNVMWLMSDRGIPKSYRMMEGFGIHTFKMINEKGEYTFVKFHWKPLLGLHSLVWDEAQKIAGKDGDFNRRDLWDSINIGQFPEYELGIQTLAPKDEFKFDFDILDCTKLWPEELVPVQKIGKLVLNKNVTNFFAETEQVAFCPANIVPGIDFSNDPMLQGRLFSYLDTQISRLGGANFHELPINRPIVAVNNNERDGMHRMAIDSGTSNYFVNALQHGEPHPASCCESAYCHHEQKVEGHVVRARSESFKDFYTQPRLFWNSMSQPEKQHIIDAFRFELGKVKNKDIRQAAVDMFNNVSGELSVQIAKGIGAVCPNKVGGEPTNASSQALSMANTVCSPMSRKVAVLVECCYDKCELDAVLKAFTACGVNYSLISSSQGQVMSSDNCPMDISETYKTTAPVLFDAIYLPGGKHIDAMLKCGEVIEYIREFYRHFKPIGVSGRAIELISAAGLPSLAVSNGKPIESFGVVSVKETAAMEKFAQIYVEAVGKARFWERGRQVACAL